MIDALWVVSLALVGGIPAWKFLYQPALRGDFAHAKTCWCAECKGDA